MSALQICHITLLIYTHAAETMQAKHYNIPPKAKLSEMRFPSQLMAIRPTYVIVSENANTLLFRYQSAG
jgi:hypothetical protein